MSKYYRFKTKTNLAVILVAIIVATLLNFGPAKISRQSVTPACSYDCGFVPCEPLTETVFNGTGFPFSYKVQLSTSSPAQVLTPQCYENVPAPLTIALNYLIFIWVGEVLLFGYSLIAKNKEMK